MTSDAFAANLYWVGTNGAATNVASNWKTTDPATCGGGNAGAAPSTGDIAIFDPDCDNDASITGTFDVAGVSMVSGYTGTISQNAVNINIRANGWVQAGGNFTGNSDGSTATITFASGGDFNLSGGVFTSTNDTMTITDDFTISNSPTFTANSGTVTFQVNVDNAGTVTINGTATFNNLTFDQNGCNHAISLASGTMVASGTLTLSTSTGCGNPSLNSSGGGVTAQSNINVSGVGWRGSATITISGSGTTILDGDNTDDPEFPALTVNKSGGSLTITDTITLIGNLTYTANSGTLTTTGSTIVLNGAITVGGTAFSMTNLTLGQCNVAITINVVVTVTGTLDFGSNACGGNTVSGSGSVSLQGNLTNTGSQGQSGSLAITMTGTNSQSINATASQFPDGTFTINKTSGTVTLLAHFTTLDATGQDLIISSGTLNMDTFNLTVADSITIGGTLTQGTGNVTSTSGTITVNSGGTWSNTSTGDISIKGGQSVTNNGTVNWDGTSTSCPETDAIALTRSSSGNASLGGSGSWTVRDVTISNFTASPVLTFSSSTNSGGNSGITFSNGCTTLPTSEQKLSYKFNESSGSFAIDSINGIDTTSGLQGYYKFDEGTGETLNDSSGNGVTMYRGTGVTTSEASDPTWTSNSGGKHGYGLQFDGGDKLTSASSGVFASSSQLTINAWVNLSAASNGVNYFIISKESGVWSLRYTGNGSAGYFHFFTGTSGGAVTVTSNNTYPTGTWVMVTGIYDSGTGLLKIYINGTLDNTNTNSGNFISGVGNSTFIGSSTGSADFFNGYMDEVRVYHRVLSDQEIAYLANNAPEGKLENTPTRQSEEMCVEGKCIYFDGTSNEHVSRGDDDKADFTATDNFTISTWAKRSGSAGQGVLMQKASANIGSTYTGYKLYMDGSGNYCFGIGDGTTVTSTCSSGTSFADGKWHHVSGVRHNASSDDKIYIYVDGVERNSTTDGTSNTLVNANMTMIGIDQDAATNDWSGFLDYVKVDKDTTARSAGKVRSDFNSRGNTDVTAEQISLPPGNNMALSSGLVGYWKMEEAGDATRLDSSGNGNTLTESTSDTVDQLTGKFGYAGDFELGDTEYISAADSASLSVTGSLTLSAWIKPEQVSAGTYNIIAKWDGSNESYRITQEANKIRLYIETGNYVEGSTALNAATLYHVVGVYDASSQTAKIYINGVQETIGATSGTIPSAIADDAGGFQIGAEDLNNTPSGNYDGIIDEARVYNRALSGAEIAQLYNWEAGPIGYYNLDEHTGQTVNNTSGNGANGTLGGSSASSTDDPTWGTGKYGSALKFDGGDKVELGTGTYELTTSAVTLSAWVNLGASASEMAILRKDSNRWNLIYDGATDKFRFEVMTGGISTSVLTNNTYGTGTWYYVTGVYDGSQIKIYVNGVLDNSTNKTGTLQTDALGGTCLGAQDCNVATNPYTGSIDEVKIYNYARTASQVIEDMNAGHPAPGSPVGSAYGYWKFDEGRDDSCSGGSNDTCNSGSGGSTIDGAKTSASWTTAGKVGKAITFAGSSNFVSIGDEAGTDGVSQATWTFWTKPTTLSTQDCLWCKVDTPIAGPVNASWGIWTDGTTSSVLRAFISNNGTTDVSQYGSSPTGTLVNGTWSYIAVVYDGTQANADRIKFYVNGLPVTTTITGTIPTTIPNTSANAVWGRASSSAVADYAGTIDEPKLFLSALTADQIKLDMNRGQTQQLGSLSSSQSNPNAASAEYCVPGDSGTCTAPVLRWDFEEASGNTAFDISGSGFDGTLQSSPTRTLGKVGRAVQLNGSTSYVDKTDNATLDVTDTEDLTLELWVYRTDTSSYDVPIAKKNCGLGTPSACPGYSIVIENSTDGNRAYFVAEDGDSTNGFTNSSTTAITANRWFHIAAVWDQDDSNNSRIYVNGVEESTRSITGTLGAIGDLSNANAFTIGKQSAGDNYAGLVDQVRVYKYARTPAQIAWDYNKGAPVGWWKMDECQGTTINDSSGNSLTGTLTGAATPGTCTTSGSWFTGVTGKRNYSLNFDPSDDYVTIPDNSKMEGFSAMSICGWGYLDAYDGTDGSVIAVKSVTAAGAVVSDPYQLWALFVQTNGSIRFTMSTGVAASRVILDSPAAAFPTSAWTHVCGTYDGSTMKLYKNGVQFPSTTSTSITVGTNSIDTRLGAFMASGVPDVWDGRLDDIKLYNYGLTAAQVKTVYQNGAVNFAPSTGAP